MHTQGWLHRALYTTYLAHASKQTSSTTTTVHWPMSHGTTARELREASACDPGLLKPRRVQMISRPCRGGCARTPLGHSCPRELHEQTAPSGMSDAHKGGGVPVVLLACPMDPTRLGVDRCRVC